MEHTETPPEQRRRFLFVILGGLGAVISGAAAWPIFRFLSPLENSGGSKQVVVDRVNVKVGDAHFLQYQGKPVVLLQPSTGQFLALSAICTHLGCVVQWKQQEAEFLCPCHGGRFSSQGTVLGGPPPKPLESIPVAVNGDQVLVG